MAKMLLQCLALLQVLIPAAALAQGKRDVVTPRIAERELSFDVGQVNAAKNRAPLIRVGPEGRVYVVETSAHLLRIYSEKGELVRKVSLGSDSVGAPGPLAAVGWLGDSLWISDPDPLEIRLFNPVGVPLPSPAETTLTIDNDPDRVPGQVLLFSDHSLLVERSPSGRSVAEGYFPQLLLLHVSKSGAGIDTLRAIRMEHAAVAFYDPATDITAIGSQPFNDASRWAMESDGDALLVVDQEATTAAGRSAYRVSRLLPSGQAAFSRTYTCEAVSLSDSIADEAVNRVVAMVGFEESIQLAVRSRLYFPRNLPPVKTVIAGNDGSIWIQRETPRRGVSRWDVLNQKGEMLGQVVVPGAGSVVAADRERLWTWDLRPDGTIMVIRYRIPSGTAHTLKPARTLRFPRDQCKEATQPPVLP